MAAAKQYGATLKGTVRTMYANKDNVDYVCQPLFGRKIGWRCGKCKRGILQSWDANCAVCKAKIRSVVEKPK